MSDAYAMLADSALPAWLRRLGLRDDDLAETRAVVTAVLADDGALATVADLVAVRRRSLGHFPGEVGYLLWPGYQAGDDPYGVGVLPLLAAVVTAPDLLAFHSGRGVPEAVTSRTLTELGQQVWVHRQTFGRFGLHTYDWLPVTWSGSLYWLGRLQVNLQRLAEGWVCSSHIPEAGPLDPAAVDASFAEAAAFFPAYFPERPVEDLWCSSWLLDPDLAAALGPASNIARFQARWHLYGEPMPGDEDALFFTFARRGPVDLADLPQDTRLQRAVVARLRAGQHWTVRQGRQPLPSTAGGGR